MGPALHDDGIARAVLAEPVGLHPESLLAVPLVRHLLADPQVQLVARGVDCTWRYERVLPVSAVGFNPLRRTVLYGVRSRFAAWLRAPRASARRHNQGDHLLHEVLFAVHDYLHAWAYLAIGHLAPEIGLTTAPLGADNLDTMAFCHLLTEAVATVGLDYWYLCTLSLDEVCPIGGALPAGLTTRYHERQLAEMRRHHPALEVQRPAFLGWLLGGYCGGALPGFDRRDLARSPQLDAWLAHELSYGRVQRELIRAWLAHLAPVPIALDARALRAPVAADAPWQRRLCDTMARLLWEKVKCGVMHRFRRGPALDRVWRSPRDRAPDFRFANAHAVPFTGSVTDASFRYWAYQTIAARPFARVDRRARDLLDPAFDRRDPELVTWLLRGTRPLPDAFGARDLMLPT